MKIRIICRIFSSVLIVALSSWSVEALPEQGKWDFNLTTNSPSVNISKSLYKNSTIAIRVLSCHSENNAEVFLKFSSAVALCALEEFGINIVDSSYETSPGEQIPCKQLADSEKTFVTDADAIHVITIDASSPTTDPFNISVHVEMTDAYGYLSVIDWPLLPFYSTMCVVYALYAFFWLIICFCYWRDLLRIQLWIGAVIFLGLVEKAVFVGEYESLNESGKSVKGLLIFAELVSCLKRTLARMLVIIVSLGFGITKPRLGSLLHRVTAIGCVYFVLSAVEGIMRVFVHKADSSPSLLIAIIPLAVTDSLICWWIFSSLVQTIRLLILKKNVIKLSLYRHFRNTMILSIIASVVFMVWSFKRHKITRCITDWKELWVDEAFWHILFSLILLVIVILWRPSANNQRYAYSPLHDLDDGEMEDIVYDGMGGDVRKKSSSRNHQSNGLSVDKEDENLKWIEENIPTSVLDIELPGLLDSEVELNQHQVHVSKME